MISLALEFSSDRRSVAVARGGEVLTEVVHEGTRQTPIFALITDALARAGVAREAVALLAVGLGPGSYTGVRLAIATAQGWQLATELKVARVNSLANLARVAAETLPDSGPVLLAVDAQRGEFAAAPAEGGRLLEPIRLLPAAELRERLTRGERIAGPEVSRLLGGGMELHPRAALTARLAAEAGHFVPAETLTPVYLREASFVKAPPARRIPGFA